MMTARLRGGFRAEQKNQVFQSGSFTSAFPNGFPWAKL